jgi:diguanylate cyclase (GGDEF)-like protein
MVPGPEPGQVWLATNNGLFLAGPDRFERHAQIQEPVFSLARRLEGPLLVGGRGRIWQLDGDQIEVHDLPGADAELAVYTLLIHGDELLQGLSTGGGLRRAPVDRPIAWTERTLEELYILAILVDASDTLWVATNSGLKRQRPTDAKPLPVRTRSLGESDWVWNLRIDREGNLWIGYQSGVIRLSPSAFRRFGAIDGLVDAPVWTYFEDPAGHVWAGTDAHGAFRRRGAGFEQAISPDVLPHATVNGFLIDRKARLWVATMRGVAWFSWPDLEPLDTPPELSDLNVLGMTEAGDGRVWLAARPGLYWWRTGELGRIDVEQGLVEPQTNDVLEDRTGRIWVGTDSGVFRGDADGMQAVGLAAGLGEYTASTLFEFEGVVWAALGGPLVRFDDDQTRIYDGHGLGTSLGSFLAMDDNGYLWLTTHQGIQRIPVAQFEEIDRGQRIQLDIDVFGRLTDPIIAQCTGGQGQAGLFQAGPAVLWCPTMNGALRFDLAAAVEAHSPPMSRLRGMRAGGEHYRLDFVERASLTLPTSARDLEVAFSGLQFRHPEGVRFRYKLHGFDPDWQDAGRRRSAFYTNLPPGDYLFEVIARNEQGLESLHSAGLQLHFTARLHETTGFRLLLVLALLLLLYAAWRYSVRQLQRRQAMLEQRVRERTQQLDKVNRQLRQASLTDPLTGLRNRRYLTEHLPQDIAQVDRAWAGPDRPAHQDLVFLMIDLDHFKRINDAHGHRVGDEVLKQFAGLLVEQARESDYIIRLGGEEFLVVSRQGERIRAVTHANRIITAVRATPFEVDGIELGCTCSIGVACYPALTTQPRALNWEAVLELADAATYIAKEEGRDRWLNIELTSTTDPGGFMQRLREVGVRTLAELGELRLVREKP